MVPILGAAFARGINCSNLGWLLSLSLSARKGSSWLAEPPSVAAAAAGERGLVTSLLPFLSSSFLRLCCCFPRSFWIGARRRRGKKGGGGGGKETEREKEMGVKKNFLSVSS